MDLTSSEPKLKLSEKLQTVFTKRSQAVTGLLIFCACVLVYELNDRTTLTSSDNITHTLLAFNWLEHHTLNFDNFRDGYLYKGGGIPYYFVEAPNGHLTSRYPIGPALVTFPLYVLFFLYLKLTALLHAIIPSIPPLPDITSEEFNLYRRSFGKLAGTISSALSVVLFYWSVRLKFNPGISLISAFIFAFATGTWALCSQDLRQHTISNLIVIGIILCLMKVERTQGRNRKMLLVVAGIFCGLLPGIRITSAVFSLATMIYVVAVYRKEAFFFLLGLPSALFHFIWNFHYFGLDNIIVGGYVKHLEERPVSYAFTFEQFKAASLGLLFSTSDGFFVYSPVLLFSIPGAYHVFKRRANRDEQLLLCLTGACLVLYLHFCFYLFWLGGSDSFGSRLMTDTLPVVCFLVAYFVAHLTQTLERKQKPFSIVLGLFVASLALSTFIQTIGVFTQTDWGTSPLPLGVNRSRIWSLSDSQIERHFRNFVAQATKPIKDRKAYLNDLQGEVEGIDVVTRTGEVVSTVDGPLKARVNERKILKVGLRNTGQSKWFGYKTGMDGMGETKLRVRFYDASGQNATQRVANQLYVAGSPSFGGQTEALGQIAFPKQPGEYRMDLTLIADGISKSTDAQAPTYTQPVTVVGKPKG